MIAFLAWVSNIDNNNWPPRPILVSAATPQDAAFGTPGVRLVRRSDCARGGPLPAVTPGVLQLPLDAAGGTGRRSVAGGTGRPRGRNPDQSRVHRRRTYAGTVHPRVDRSPNAYVVPGPTFSAAGQSIMPAIYDTTLKPADIDHLVAYLATLK